MRRSETVSTSTAYPQSHRRSYGEFLAWPRPLYLIFDQFGADSIRYKEPTTNKCQDEQTLSPREIICDQANAEHIKRQPEIFVAEGR